MTIPSPYLLYLGSSNDEIGIKTSRGLATFRPEACVGEFRSDGSRLTLGLPRLTFTEAAKKGAKTLVLGITNPGGRLPDELIADAIEAVGAGLNVASGLHQRLRDEPRLVEAARRASVSLFDVRDAPEALTVGSGAPRLGRRLLTVGTDCSVGKMYATLALCAEMRARGMLADFRATGQTGILIAGSGVPLDAVIADFISGAVEAVSPSREDGGWDLIEGQGSLFHPAFAGVSTGLLHGAQPDAIVLCHDPARPHLRGLPDFPLPALDACLAANLQVASLTNADVQAVGIALNTSKMDAVAASRLCAETADQFSLPCTDPFRFGAGVIVDRIIQCFGDSPPATIAST